MGKSGININIYQNLGVNPPVASQQAQQAGNGTPIAIMRVITSDSSHTERRLDPPDAVIAGVGLSVTRSLDHSSTHQSACLSRPLTSDGRCSIGQRPRSHASPSSKQRPPCQCPITSSPHLLDAPSRSCPPATLRVVQLASNDNRKTNGTCLHDRSRTRSCPRRAPIRDWGLSPACEHRTVSLFCSATIVQGSGPATSGREADSYHRACHIDERSRNLISDSL